MSSIPKLIESTLDDFGLLARQYAQLTSLRAKKISRYGLMGMGILGTAATLLVIVFAEVIFSLAAKIIENQQLSQIALIAAGLTTALAVIFAGIGRAVLKKIDLDPRASSSLKTPDVELPLKQLKPRGI